MLQKNHVDPREGKYMMEKITQCGGFAILILCQMKKSWPRDTKVAFRIPVEMCKRKILQGIRAEFKHVVAPKL